MNEDMERARADLERIAGTLTDVSIRLLAEALEEGAGVRPALEKRVSQARRAVEKAIHLLEDPSDTPD